MLRPGDKSVQQQSGVPVHLPRQPKPQNSEFSYHAYEVFNLSLTCLYFHRTDRLIGNRSLCGDSGFTFGSQSEDCRNFQNQCQNIFSGDLNRGAKEPRLESGQDQGTLKALGHYNEEALDKRPYNAPQP